MLISVIVPVYNEEKYLPQCIESVLGQTYKNLELILVDDGSTDSCPQIIEAYRQKDRRVVALRQQNLGAGMARNRGLDAAKGEYITFLDCDDWLDTNCFGYLLNVAKPYMANGLDAIVWGFNTYDGRKYEKAANIDTRYFSSGRDFFYKYLVGEIGGGAGINPCKLFYKDFLDKNKLRYKKYRRAQDGLFNSETRLFFQHVLTVDYYGYYYRVEHALAHESMWSKKDVNFYRDVISCVGENISFTREGIKKYGIHDKKIYKACANFQIYELEIMEKRIAYDKLNVKKKIELSQFLIDRYTDLNMVRRSERKGIKWKFLDKVICKRSARGLLIWMYMITEFSSSTWYRRIMGLLTRFLPRDTYRGRLVRRLFGRK